MDDTLDDSAPRRNALRRLRPQAAAAALVAACTAEGGTDNATALIAACRPLHQ